jgi:uncharacterized membrane protein YpjA
MEWWEAVLVGMNLVFAAVGFFTYIPQLSATPVLLWIFVPDCAIAWMVFAIAYLIKKEDLSFFSFVTGLKYTIWSILAVALYTSDYVQTPLIAFLIVVTHLILFTSVFLLKPKFSWRAAGFTLGFLLLSDFSDYIFGTYPLLPSDLHLTTMMVIAVMSTIGLTALASSWQTINKRIVRMKS